MKSPQNGWVAIGINTEDNLIHSNLIMGSINHGKPILSDRHVISLGNHKSMEELFAHSQTELIFHSEENGTLIQFSIPNNSIDNYHYNLIKGNTYYLVMAYSMEDDFSHHSIMRTTVKIIL